MPNCQVCKKPLGKKVLSYKGYKFDSAGCKKRFVASDKKGVCEFC